MKAVPPKQSILYSCIGEAKAGQDHFVREHSLSFVTSGIAEYYTDHGVVTYPAGSLCLFRRNQLLRILKKPADGKPFAAITVFLDQETLKKHSLKYNLKTDIIYTGEPNVLLQSDAFMKGYFVSMIPYFDEFGKLTPILEQAKTTEAIELLLRNPVLKSFLFDFNEPYKIDLEAYMNNHFWYNVPLVQFAKLTGRSLSSFKRDFKGIFHASPERWMQKRKLEMAHFLISQKKRKPSDVYLEVGFQNLSHFSKVFKKEYNINASAL
jgi:AraC-like DNA-binding protein